MSVATSLAKSPVAGIAGEALKGLMNRVVVAGTARFHPGAIMGQETFLQIAEKTGVRGANSALTRAYQMGRGAVAKHPQRGALGETALTELAQGHFGQAGFQNLKSKATGSVSGTLFKSGGAGIVAGLAMTALMIPLKLAAATVDLAVRAVTLNRVKSNLRNTIGIGTMAKWSALGTGALTLGSRTLQSGSRSEAVEMAYLAGMKHENAAILGSGPAKVQGDPFAHIPKGRGDNPTQMGKANYHAVRDAVEQGQNPLSVVMAANEIKFNPKGNSIVSDGDAVEGDVVRSNVKPAEDKNKGAAK